VRPARTPTALRDAVHDMVLAPHDLRPVVTDPQPSTTPAPPWKLRPRPRPLLRRPDRHRRPRQPRRHRPPRPWPTGPTAAHNLASRSPRTHQLKHYGWQAERTTDGTWWTSPAGQTVLNPSRHDPPPDVHPGSRAPDP
jgi:hypothetical protein